MTRRGQCRCGAVLTFRKTSQGYKMRCPACQAVVRLRCDGPATHRPRSHNRVLRVPAPPPLPVEAVDFSVLPLHVSTAPPARVDLPVYRESNQTPAAALGGWLLAGSALAVLAVVVVVTVLLS